MVTFLLIESIRDSSKYNVLSKTGFPSKEPNNTVAVNLTFLKRSLNNLVHE